MALSLFESKEKLLISERTNALSVSDAFNSGAHLALLKKWDELKTIATMTQMLTELLLFVPNNLSGEQVVYMAESLIIDNENWKPDDILIVLRNGKQGKYGKIYGNFSYQTLNEWADAYAKERQAYVENQHLSTKEPSTTREEIKHELFSQRKANQIEERKEEMNMRKYINDIIQPKQ